MRRSPYHLTAPQQRQEPDIGSRSVPAPYDYDQYRSVTGPQHPSSEPQSIWVPTHAARYAAARSFEQDSERHGVRMMETHLHPMLQSQIKSPVSRRTRPRVHMGQSQLSQPQGLTSSVIASLRDQLVRLLSALHKKDMLFEDTPSSSKRRWNSASWIVLPVVFLVFVSYFDTGPFAFRRTDAWSRLERRQLQGRQCVMNLFVDKQLPDEYNPDYVDPTKLTAPVSIDVEGTYRTKGQMKVISRFISSVANSFRSNIHLQQHVIFAGVRDAGHLAEEAFKHWPPRGDHRTQLHVFAAPADDALDYDTIEGIETRFETKGGKRVHLYDSYGNLAGDLVDDEDDDEDMGDESTSSTRRRLSERNDTDLQSIIFADLDGDELDANVVVPYMHVDADSMEQQMGILQRASPLLEATKIVVVGLEHAPDLDIQEMIEFFRSKNYKTFMLGLRQLTRIDNLCPELLENMLEHPSFDAMVKQASWVPWSRAAHTKPSSNYPPFFVAMPKGRHNKEEMTIQHMYDLFSGSGGGGQVKTANDRKAPGK